MAKGNILTLGSMFHSHHVSTPMNALGVCISSVGNILYASDEYKLSICLPQKKVEGGLLPSEIVDLKERAAKIPLEEKSEKKLG